MDARSRAVVVLLVVLGRDVPGDLRPGVLFLLFGRDDPLPAGAGARVLQLLLLLVAFLARTPPPTISDFLRRNGTSRLLRAFAPLLKSSCSGESSGSTGGFSPRRRTEMSYSCERFNEFFLGASFP